MATMKAIHIHDFVKSLDELTPSTIPVPSPPEKAKEPWYLVRVKYVSLTHVDTLYARGLHQNNNRQRGFVHPPFTLGMEFSGVVVKVYRQSSLSGSEGFREGEKVWGTWLGAFATYMVAPQSSLHALPARLSLRDAAALGASTVPVSYGALMRIARLRKGETCLVHAAAGGLGIVAVQIALAVGANVIGTVGSESKAKVIDKLIQRSQKSNTGLPSGNGVVRYDQEGWEDRVKEICGGRGVDVVFDTVGLVEKSIRCCAFNARIVIIGFVGRGGEMEKVAMNRVLLKQIQLLGYRYGETSRRMPAETEEVWKGLASMLDTNGIQPVVHREFVGLDRVPEALKMMTTREVAGKIVVNIDEDEDEDAEDRKQDREARARL